MTKTYTLDDYANYESYHRELWTWLAENPDNTKEDWFGEFWKDDTVPNSYCFACEIDNLVRRHLASNEGIQEGICKRCPIGSCTEFFLWEDCITQSKKKE